METISNTTCKHFDYYVLTASSNLRGMVAYNALLKKGVSIDNLLVLDFDFTKPKDEMKELSENYAAYSKLLNATVVKCHQYTDCSDFFNTLPLNSNHIIGLDITGFLTPDFFKTIYVLKEIKGIKEVDVFYTESNDYFSLSASCDTYKYFDGEIKYSVLNEYYISSNDKQEVLVCFLGFDKGLSNYVNDIINPSKTIAVNGFPAYYPKLKDYSLLNNYELLSKIGKENIFYTTANNPFASYNTLCEVSKSFPDSILNICVLGNKPMALGACLFALNHSSISKVSFPYPQKYNIDASKTSNNCWHYQIKFSQG